MEVFTELKSFLKSRSLSINYAATLFNVNYSTMRSLIAGNASALQHDARIELQQRVQVYLDDQRRAESLLYQRVFPIISDVPTHISRSVLRTLAKDVDAL